MTMWNDWRAFKTLPHDGDFGDQPAHVVEAIAGIEAEYGRIEAERLRPPKKVDKRPPPGRTAPTLTSSRK